VVHLPVSLQVPFSKFGELIDLNLTDLFLLSDHPPEPVINVLATRSETAQNWPRYEIDSRTGGFAVAGTNWLGASSAELYLEADAPGIKRGFAKAVLSALVREKALAGKKLYLRLDNHDSTVTSAVEPMGFQALDVPVIQAGYLPRLESQLEEGP
jgi:hypothetical protein